MIYTFQKCSIGRAYISSVKGLNNNAHYYTTLIFMLRHSSGMQLFIHRKRRNKVNKTSKVKKLSYQILVISVFHIFQ